MSEMRDRRATPKELHAAHRRVLKRGGGPGIQAGARRLGISAGYLCMCLQGLVPQARWLKLSDLRRLRDGEKPCSPTQ